jgi:hypothetical protein
VGSNEKFPGRGRSVTATSVVDPGCVKTRLAKDAQNCFLNCLLPKEVASTIDSHIDEIEMEVLHASWTSEFSHNLDPKRTEAVDCRNRFGTGFGPYRSTRLNLPPGQERHNLLKRWSVELDGHTCCGRG